MKFITQTDSLLKTLLLCTGAALLLSACGEKTATSTNGAVDGRSSYETPQDHALGNANAPITVVEYASVTCAHCATWNNTVWHDFRTKFVDTGKVRYVFREFPTNPVDLAMAGHLLANCAPADKYFDLIHTQFTRQREILTSPDKKAEYVGLAKSAGMSEADFNTCMTNQAEIDRLNEIVNKAFDQGITGTPTFVVNGKKFDSQIMFNIKDIEKAFAEILGEPIPKDKDEKQPSEKSDGVAH